MTLLQRVSQSSKLNIRRLYLTTKRTNNKNSYYSSLTQSSQAQLIDHRSRHNFLASSTTTSSNRSDKNINDPSLKQSSRYVNIPPNKGSGVAATGGDGDDDDIFYDNESFNEEDYFKSTDMEFYDDIDQNNSNTNNALSLESVYDNNAPDIINKKTQLQIQEEKEYERRQQIRDEIDARTGRLWEDPWAITDEDWSSGRSFDDLPDWTEQLCSRISKERVKLHPDGVPTLDQLATLKHEPSAQPHPALGNPHPYLKHRKQSIYNTIYDAVVSHAETKVAKIIAMENWDEKQNAIDDLFEEIHDKVRYNSKKKKTTTKKGKNVKDNSSNSSSGGGGGLSGKSEEEFQEYMSVVLGSQPDFPKLVQGALEDYLKNVVKEEKSKLGNDDNSSESSSLAGNDETSTNEPIFMDILKAPNSTVDEVDVPKILAPIKPHAKDGPGRMLEEWELSAKRDTKRIMLRECITDIAKSMVETQGENSDNGSRIFVSGREGVGKSATLAAVVASARLSGHIVLYIPDGRRLSHLGFYCEPNVKSRADGDLLFDLPILTNEMCAQFLECHEKDLDGMVVTSDTIKKFLTSDQLQKSKDLPKPKDDVYSLVDLLKVGSESITVGAACYQAVIDTLMNQSETPFTVVMDEFNCYFDHGHYYHAKYDPEVKKSIPLNKITLFKHFIDAVGVEKLDDGTVISKEAVPMKRGSIVVGTSESHAVKRTFTAKLEQAVKGAGCKFVTVPQYTPLEVEHILANFEIIGIGRLRFDRGATVMNNQEVSFLRMVSGGIGQRLLDSCTH